MATDPAALIAAAQPAAPVAAAPAPIPAAAQVIPVASPAPVVTETLTPAIAAPVVTVSSSALQGQLVTAATGLASMAGVFLVAHGALTEDQRASLEPMIIQLIAGTAMAVLGFVGAHAKAWISHSTLLSAAITDPANIVVK